VLERPGCIEPKSQVKLGLLYDDSNGIDGRFIRAAQDWLRSVRWLRRLLWLLNRLLSKTVGQLLVPLRGRRPPVVSGICTSHSLAPSYVTAWAWAPTV
jgi:hypothetical protein